MKTAVVLGGFYGPAHEEMAGVLNGPHGPQSISSRGSAASVDVSRSTMSAPVKVAGSAC